MPPYQLRYIAICWYDCIIFGAESLPLTVSPELELAFYELGLDVVLPICVEMPVDMEAKIDLSFDIECEYPLLFLP